MSRFDGDVIRPAEKVRAGTAITTHLLSEYGPLMRLEQLAEFLKRSADGLRYSLARDASTAALLGPTKIRVGRHVYFRTEAVGQVLDSFDSSHGG